MSEITTQNIWDVACKRLSEQVSESTFRIWISKAQAVRVKDDMATLVVPDRVTSEMLSRRYSALLADALSTAAGQTLGVEIITPEEWTVIKKNEETSQEQSALNPRYTFATFVTGNSNRFAHAASKAVADAPAKAYNPLFIYGGAGLGKTHLMHAIGNTILQQNPAAKVMYTSTENFTNILINAITSNAGKSMQEFRDTFRRVDVLMIDDIQFIAGKTQTQEEFFHTFNALHEAGKQIVISSDKQPREIPTLEDRMRSRFEWGLIADIQRPEMETRIAILRRKAQTENFVVPEDVNHYIAEKIDTNIRELEGSLNRVVAYSLLVQRPITTALAEEALKDLYHSRERASITPEYIIAIVCSYFGVKLDDLSSKRRDREINIPRQVAMFLIRENTDCALGQVGQYFGGRDHTTVLHACQKIADELKTDLLLRTKISDLRKQITEL